jgi:ETFB lysine methyltransferase
MPASVCRNDVTDRCDEIASELLAHFPLRDFEISVGARSYTLTTAEDIEQLINRITEEQFSVDERLPYWAELWHSALALAGFLAEHPSRLEQTRVLEIGCGLALPGIVAASLGARLTCGDFEPLALKAAELNLRRNVHNGVVDMRLMDFRNDPGERWPVILAADVIYEKRFVEPLAGFLDQAIEEGGVIYLAEPNRLIAVPFFESLTARGFRYTRHSSAVDLHSRTIEISIYQITR